MTDVALAVIGIGFVVVLSWVGIIIWHRVEVWLYGDKDAARRGHVPPRPLPPRPEKKGTEGAL